MNDFHVVFAEGKHQHGTEQGAVRFVMNINVVSAPRFRLINTERSTSSSVIVSPIIARISSRIAENLSITETDMGIVATEGVPVVVYDFVLPFASVSP